MRPEIDGGKLVRFVTSNIVSYGVGKGIESILVPTQVLLALAAAAVGSILTNVVLYSVPQFLAVAINDCVN
ncbi:MAG TPA: hypothetical protein VJK30_02460 [Coxiellaceae bacterium]|nr:MAG: hypothetical protein A3E81_02460 [Gammaproteobacteria bacterium RIFCSPHIGHO2_12_FULL_36_30]HLB56177.1 hypothetical protein [Coxiellaceae bacterium]